MANRWPCPLCGQNFPTEMQRLGHVSAGECNTDGKSGMADALRALDAANERWQAVKDYLGKQIDQDEATRVAFLDYPDDGFTSRAHGSLVAANRNTWAMMRDLEGTGRDELRRRMAARGKGT
jgi:hypothetical protein